MDEAGVSELFSFIAQKIFGEDAFRDLDVARPIVKDGLYEFIKVFVSHIWNSMRQKVTAHFERLRVGRLQARRSFESTWTHRTA